MGAADHMEPGSVRGDAVLGMEQVNIGLLDEVSCRHAEPRHELIGLGSARSGGLAIGKDDLELEEIAEAFDRVDVDASPAHEKESTLFAHHGAHTVGCLEGLSKQTGRPGRHDSIA